MSRRQVTDDYVNQLYRGVNRARYRAMALAIALGGSLAFIIALEPGSGWRLTAMCSFLIILVLLTANEGAILRMRRSIDRVERMKGRGRGVDYE